MTSLSTSCSLHIASPIIIHSLKSIASLVTIATVLENVVCVPTVYVATHLAKALTMTYKFVHRNIYDFLLINLLTHACVIIDDSIIATIIDHIC